MIGIICFWDRYATPYLAKYERELIQKEVSFEVVFWNRTPDVEIQKITRNENEISINIKCCGSKFAKASAFFKWKKEVQIIIHERKYEQLILLSTVPAILLYRTLIQNYKGKYIFDIRDYTMEENLIFKKMVMSIIDNSALTAISSKGYMRWLKPSPKIMVNHNITIDTNYRFEPPCFSKINRRINFAFVGNVRLDTQTEALLLSLKNDPIIDQYFFGRIIPGCKICEIQQKENIQNLYLPGAFTVEDKKDIFQKIDLINCVYANAERDEDIPLGDSTPLPNRLYDALTFSRPIVASRGTYLAELVEKYNLGCCVNGFDKEARSIIIQYISTFDPYKFVQGCNELKEIVVEEEKKYLFALQKIIDKWR